MFLAAGLCLATTELLAQFAFTECMYYLLAWYVALFWMVLEGESDGGGRHRRRPGGRVRRFLPRAHEHLLIAAAAFLTVTKFSYAMAILAAMAGVTLRKNGPWPPPSSRALPLCRRGDLVLVAGRSAPLRTGPTTSGTPSRWHGGTER